jgi:hypothetical protein
MDESRLSQAKSAFSPNILSNPIRFVIIPLKREPYRQTGWDRLDFNQPEMRLLPGVFSQDKHDE